MKKLFFVFAAGLFFTSCAMTSAPLTGFVYQDLKSPVAVTSNTGATKVGTATANSVLGIVATGDASVEAAAKSAGIKKIHHVDQHATNILGIYATYTITVYGE